MTELEKIKYAKSYIDKLANGVNPLNDTVINENDVINNVRISRCLFYVSDVLKQVIQKGGVKTVKKNLINFNLTDEQLSNFQYSETPIPVSEIAKRFNNLITNENMKKISHKDITKWLISIGLLCETKNPYNDKISKKPTVQGEDVGITTEVRTGLHGSYTVTIYNKSAQEFVVDNLSAILNFKNQ